MSVNTYFSSTRFRTLGYLLASSLALGYLSTSSGYVDFPRAALVIFLIFLLPRHRVAVVLAGSVLSYFFFEQFFVPMKYGQRHLEILPIEAVGFSEKCLVLICLMAMLYFLGHLVHWISGKIKIDSTVGGVIALPCIVFLSFYLSQLLTPVQELQLLIPTMAAGSVWYFLLYIRQIGTSTSQHFSNLLMTLHPFMTRSMEGQEFLNLRFYETSTEEEMMLEVKNGALLIIRGVLIIEALKLLGLWLAEYLRRKYQLPDTNPSHLEIFARENYLVSMRFSPEDHWLLLFWSGFNFLFETNYGYGGICIGIARSMGFTLHSVTDHPWRARTFAEFCGRFLYYYSYILNNYFYLPMRRLLNKWRAPMAFAKPFAMFFAIYVGGVYYHFLRDVRGIFKGPPVDGTIKYIFITSPFFIFWGLACALSFIGTKKSKGSAFKFVFFTFVYCFIFSTRYVSYFSSREEAINYYLHFLGLSLP